MLEFGGKFSEHPMALTVLQPSRLGVSYQSSPFSVRAYTHPLHPAPSGVRRAASVVLVGQCSCETPALIPPGGLGWDPGKGCSRSTDTAGLSCRTYASIKRVCFHICSATRGENLWQVVIDGTVLLWR